MVCTDTFQCDKTTCIHYDEVCDGYASCMDGKDEFQCGKVLLSTATIDKYVISLRNEAFIYALRGYCTPNQKLSCFEHYFKIEHFLKYNICIL